MLHHTAAVRRTFAGLFGRPRSVFGVARHFLDGRGHFVHGRGDLVDFVFLQCDASTGLFADSRQLLGGCGDLRDTVADAADKAAQGNGHVLHGVLQQAQFVLTGRTGILSQVTVGDPARGDDCIVQRNGDLASDQQRSKDTTQ
ncbi:hypothetical protein ALP29_201302 [Pseudomonas syringae pv. avii]|uniref:Uncharacterized protein n=1 Tax=Pseudomonas syringae pv. avii TaxID=663959 RepID=A0A3M5UF70_PSESX|nr:hypothetical protein ALP29_201302 [Pseudomonas syringae pv. avii]